MIVVETWDEAQRHIEEHASESAYRLPELTARLGEDLHELVLDPESRILWWAYDNGPLDGEGWTVTHGSAEELSDYADLAQDELDDPDQADRHRSAHDALDEYVAVLRLGLPETPEVQVEHIRGQRRLIARQDALWQRAYADLVRELSGTPIGGRTPHGGASSAARVIGRTSVQVARILEADERMRDSFR